MDMQDKEFDELFRAKLDGLETEPSANIWPAIANELDSVKRRKGLAPWLSIAAGIVVLIGIGVFFIPKKTNTGMHPPVKNGVAKTTQPVASTAQTVAVQAAQVSPVKKHTVKIKRSSEIARVQHNQPATR